MITSLLIAPTDYGGHGWARNIAHSIKRPLESRVWYAYGNTWRWTGVYPWPTAIGLVLDGGASQVTTMTYNAQGGMTSKLDPAGRQTTYTYATNGLDVLTVDRSAAAARMCCRGSAATAASVIVAGKCALVASVDGPLTNDTVTY